jgi:hypothetical protein
MSPNVGRVIWNDDGGEHTAELRADRTWHVPDDPIFERFLDSTYGRDAVDADFGPANGHFGPQQLHEVAARIGGVAHIEPLPAGNPNVEY